MLIRRLATESPDSALVQRTLGSVERGRGATEAALQAFERALAMDSADRAARKGLIRTYVDLGKIYRVIEQHENVLAMDPYAHESNAAMADLHAAKDDYSAAVAEYQRALDISPEDHEILERLGHALNWVGRKREAKPESCELLAEMKAHLGIAHVQNHVGGRRDKTQRVLCDCYIRGCIALPIAWASIGAPGLPGLHRS